MARYVIDAPTLLHVLDRAIAFDPSHQLVAPSSIRSEALQLLFDAVRRGERTESEALAIHEQITATKMRLLGDRVSRTTAWRLAREHGWDALRDAEYVAVTRLQADALVTVDLDLLAKARGVVPLERLEALISGTAGTPD
jgi:predicted nucleic acid-binding protein